MATIYRPDTCTCRVEYSDTEVDNDGDPKLIKVLEKCKEHNSYKEMLAHNRSFNLKHGRKPTLSQIDEITSDKKAEKLRISKL